MIATGTRDIKDITDAELRMFVEIVGHYGAKEYWGEFKITDIDREMFDNTIVIDYTQTRLSDGVQSNTTLFFNYRELSYHVAYYYPYERSSGTETIFERTQLTLWLLAQDFNLLEYMTYASIKPENGQSRNTHCFLVGRLDSFDKERGVKEAKVFNYDQKSEAIAFMKEQRKNSKYCRLYRITDVEFQENED